MKRFRALGWLVIVVGLGAVVGLLYRVAKPPEVSGVRQLALPERTAMAMEGRSRVTSTEDGRMIWTLIADGIVFTNQPDVVRVTAPTAWVPMRDGGTVEVSGRSGRYFKSGEDLALDDEIKIQLNRRGRLEWVLDGDTGSYRKTEEAFYISRLAGLIYPEGGETVEIQGARGRYDSKAKTMSVAGDVVCVYSKGITLRSEDLYYNMEREEATTESAVVITGDGFRLTGRGLIADLKSKKVAVEREVRVRVEKGLGGKK